MNLYNLEKMETQKKSQTVFIEYSKCEEGQHFMTVVENQNHKRIIIGRVFYEKNEKTKEMEYVAKDFSGKRIFEASKNLPSIKMEFVAYGEILAKQALLKRSKQKNLRINKGKQILTREQIIGIHRERMADKNKDKKQEVSKTNKQDLRRIERTKDQEQIKEKEASKEKEQDEKLNHDEIVQEEPIENEKSEREIELENIREQNDDREQEQEIDR